MNGRFPRKNQERISAAFRWIAMAFLLLAPGDLALFAEDPAATFDQANRFYEEGKYPEAIQAYDQIIHEGKVSAALFFNLGNAWFKNGRLGQAIVCYRQAAVLSPRDPDIQANLRFTRDMIAASKPAGRLLQRWLGRLALNEWAVLFSAAAWLWFGLLISREWRPRWRPALRRSIIAAGVLWLCVAASFGTVLYQREYRATAVVVVPEAIVRHGPLAESQSFYPLPDGAEVDVLDHKGEWIQVSDSAKRAGWVRQDQVIQWPIHPTGSVTAGQMPR